MTQESSVVFPEHFGFCEGVAASDDLLRDVTLEAQRLNIPNVYGYHEIVHNTDVVAAHVAAGVIFVEHVDEVPNDSVVVTSAHGVSPQVTNAFVQKGSVVFDAACPLVLHTHKAAKNARIKDETLIYVHGGNLEHDEVIGMIGHMDYDYDPLTGELRESPINRSLLKLNQDPESLFDEVDISSTDKFRVVTQTTLHANESLVYRDVIKYAIQSKRPEATVAYSAPGDVCRAVADRQKGVETLVELLPKRIVVVTDPGSKNGMGYVKLATELTKGQDVAIYAVNSVEEAKALGIESGVTAITASASTPDYTTFAVAQELGMQSMPEITRERFNLHDAREGVIQQKLAAHLLRIS